jgi:N-acyl-D-aspartate/D-glutamate deacylase
MIDVIIRGGEVIDGTGAPRRTADVGIDGGRVVAVGQVDESARRTVDAGGCVVAPGFIDVHTHLDVQGFWDQTLSPSPLHGVTTVIGGNCGFSVAPLSADATEYLLQMLAKVEGMPLSALRQGVPWDWHSTSDYLERFERRLSINAGFMIGHSPLRRVVMGTDATERPAEPNEIAAMSALLADGLRAGGLGLSTSWGFAHRDGDGRPVPSSHAPAAELIQLASVCRDFDGTSIEFIPPHPNAPFEAEVMDVMVAMSVAAQRPLNWNLMNPSAANADVCAHNLGVYASAKRSGGHVVALTNPFPSMLRISFDPGFLLDALPGWAPVMSLPPQEKLAILSDPVRRRELELSAARPSGAFDLVAKDWGGHFIFDTHSEATRRYQGRYLQDVAAEMGKSAFDALLDIVCADDLKTGFGRATPSVEPEDLAVRARIWENPGALVGGSDTGAHLDMLATFSLTTTFLARAVREFGVMTTERAVHHLTGRPAALYGLVDRGILAEGAHGDVVVFDEQTVAPSEVSTRFDLPGGAGRLYAEAVGVHSVFVNGVLIVDDGNFTDARPGDVVRSGTDTHTSALISAG